MSRGNVRFGSDAHQRIMGGATALANAVAVTLGPRGRNVMIESDDGPPRITKDGATVARQISFNDRFASLGAHLVRDVADRMDNGAGDGTTTATVLAHSILLEGLRTVTAQMNPTCVMFGISAAIEAAVAAVGAQSRPVASGELATVASISANGDKAIGELIARAIGAVGRDGTILIEEHQSADDRLETITGMNFDRGYISRHFVTNEDDLSVDLKNPFILLHEGRIDDLTPLLRLLDAIVAAKRPLLIIADDVVGDALSTLVVNRERGGLKVAAVRAPGTGNWRTSWMDDLAVLTEGQVVYAGAGMSLDNVTLDMLGKAKRVKITKDKTLIVGGAGSDDKIEQRCRQLRLMSKTAKSEFERDRLLERLGKLSTGVAVIRVGGVTETEIKEKRDRVDDALYAIRAALADGVVAGGGAALLHATRALDGLNPSNTDEKAGVEIVRRALQTPAQRIADNAGTDGKIAVTAVTDRDDPSYGYDAQTGTFGDLMSGGVLDPARMVCSALRHAASVAGILITADVVIGEKPAKTYPRHPFACKCSDHDHHYHDDPNHAHGHGHHHHHHH